MCLGTDKEKERENVKHYRTKNCVYMQRERGGGMLFRRFLINTIFYKNNFIRTTRLKFPPKLRTN